MTKMDLMNRMLQLEELHLYRSMPRSELFNMRFLQIQYPKYTPFGLDKGVEGEGVCVVVTAT